MPDEVLSGDDTRPLAGFFGKLPSTGDFVGRGLPDTFRRAWDAWLTRHIAPLQREGRTFPPAGLRFRLPSGGHLAAGVILPGEDSAGRLFPLSLVLIAAADLPPERIDPWCDAALALDPATRTADDLWQALDALPSPDPRGGVSGPMQLWSAGGSPLACPAAEPTEALRLLIPADAGTGRPAAGTGQLSSG